MLFFIAIQAADEFFRKGIQIHLMLFFIQRKMGRRQSEWSIQIHLMLFFIRSASGSSGTAAQFKYISCYSLSEQENKIVQTWEHSNTSHVILYLIERCEMKSDMIDSNTSHVILYQFDIRPLDAVGKNSNTSHVILYQAPANNRGIFMPIQIHLMLFFILNPPSQPLPLIRFKYISCYSLSLAYLRQIRCGNLFKYISCYSLSRFSLLP